MRFAPGSFRDPDTRVLADGGERVLRALSQPAAEFDLRLRRAGVIQALVHDGLLIDNARCDDVPIPDGWAALVQSPRVPFVSYPYEWSFGMLRDAALLTLRLTERALANDVLIKDASAFNVLFDGAAPVFVDIGSLGPYQPESPWLAYGQFCDHFLAPLLLESCRGVAFQPFLRGNLNGLSISEQLAPLLSARDLLRPGVLMHARLRAMLDRRTRQLDTAARGAVRRVKVPKAAVLHNVQRLQTLVAGLRSRASSDWANYDAANTYDAAVTARKEAFVCAAVARIGGGGLAWDVGANVGRYSRLLAPHYRRVVALDADPGSIDRLYDALRNTAQARTILPLVMDFMNPSPPCGWAGHERQGVWERGRPDLVLYLALVHHICLGQGVPLRDFLDQIRATSNAAVVEFIAADDPMSQAVLATKVVTHPDYSLESFRALASEGFSILAEEALTPTRHLFLLAARA